jgi:hypothetical protein
VAKMLEFGVDFQKMNVAHLSAVLQEIVHANLRIKTTLI